MVYSENGKENSVAGAERARETGEEIRVVVGQISWGLEVTLRRSGSSPRAWGIVRGECLCLRGRSGCHRESKLQEGKQGTRDPWRGQV